MALPMKPMKSMKAMKAKKKVSVIAKGPRAKVAVFKGTKTKTVSGLKKEMLTKNKRGKVVSKKASAAGKKQYKNIASWVAAVSAARKALGLKGFIAVNVKSGEGKALYAKAKA